MQIIAALGGGAFVLASFAVGARLLALAARTRQIPELTLGLGLFLMGGLGYPLTMVAEYATGLPDGLRIALVACNQGCGIVGLTCIGIFTWRVFRPETRGARAIVYAGAVGYVAIFAVRATTTGFAPISMGGEAPLPPAHSVLTTFSLGWAGVEALAYHLTLKKRLRLGLADAVVTNRFLLWAVGILFAMSLATIWAVATWLGIDFNASTIGTLVVGVMGSTSACCVWLAFFPPARYARWVEARAAAA